MTTAQKSQSNSNLVEYGEQPSVPSESKKGLINNKWFHFVIAILHVTLCGGVFFNWTSLLIMMQRDGFYHDLCPAGTPTNEICDEQSKKFNSIYNNAFYSSAVANGVFGLAVDAIGAKLTGGISTAMVTLGSLLMTFTPDNVSLVSPAVVLLALGGPGINFAAITISNLFKNSQFIITCFSGFFTLATIVFLIFDQIHKAGVALRTIFCVYTCVCILFSFYTTVNIYPFNNYKPGDSLIGFSDFSWVKTCLPAVWMKIKTLFIGFVKSIKPKDSTRRERVKARNLFGQFFSIEYLLALFYLTALFYNSLFFLGTSEMQLREKGDDDGTYNELLSYLNQVGFVAFMVQGLLIDHMKGYPFFIIHHLLFILWAMLNVYGGLKIQAFNFIVFSFWRSGFNPLFFCVVKRCCGTRFFFTLSGLGFCISELISTTHRSFLDSCLQHGFKTANIVIFIVGVISAIIIPMYIYIEYHEKDSDGAVQEKDVESVNIENGDGVEMNTVSSEE